MTFLEQFRIETEAMFDDLRDNLEYFGNFHGSDALTQSLALVSDSRTLIEADMMIVTEADSGELISCEAEIFFISVIRDGVSIAIFHKNPETGEWMESYDKDTAVVSDWINNVELLKRWKYETK